ncbi:MAG: hypothetical protein COA62_01605 [Rhodobiaceae bacterium]|nr:MAG: hypothetical protein COA62_01605 [Rhodobiaceae bacterium]
MSEQNGTGIHWSFWVIAIVGLIWNAMGSANFVMQMDAETVAQMPESYRAIVEARPAWATAAFAVAVFGGALGCLLLLLRKSAALYVFVASFLGVTVQMTTTLGQFGATIGVASSLVVAVFLIWYAKYAQRRTWIS